MTETPALYHMPHLSSVDLGFVRSPGPGLGNLLLPIARAFAAQQTYGGRLVYPTFRQIKIGSVLRRERDSRTYGNLFNARTGTEWSHWLRAQSRRKVSEDHLQDTHATGKPATIRYAGLEGYFHKLQGASAPFGGWLDRHARYDGLLTDTYDIALHIRLGDFQPTNEDVPGQSYRQSFDWYRNALAHARDLLGLPEARVVLFTDEDPVQVGEELGLANIMPDPGRNAVTAIRNLSRAKMIVTSRSSFSMWGVFLGGTQAIWHKNFDLASRMPLRPDHDHFL